MATLPPGGVQEASQAPPSQPRPPPLPSGGIILMAILPLFEWPFCGFFFKPNKAADFFKNLDPSSQGRSRDEPAGTSQQPSGQPGPSPPPPGGGVEKISALNPFHAKFSDLMVARLSSFWKVKDMEPTVDSDFLLLNICYNKWIAQKLRWWFFLHNTQYTCWLVPSNYIFAGFTVHSDRRAGSVCVENTPLLAPHKQPRGNANLNFLQPLVFFRRAPVTHIMMWIYKKIPIRANARKILFCSPMCIARIFAWDQ